MVYWHGVRPKKCFDINMFSNKSAISAQATEVPARRRGGVGVVDIFCGAGGLSHGFLLEGFDVRAGVDVDPACRYPFECNNQSVFLERDVGELSGATVKGLFAEAERKILVGCAPCQPFSSYNHSRTNGKWRLLREFGRLVCEVEPDVVSMENVARLTKFREGELFADFLGLLADVGYEHVWYDIVDCSEFSVPQTRRRLVVLASRIGPIRLRWPTDPQQGRINVRTAIGHLPTICAGGQDQADPLHRASRLSPTNLARIRASRPGMSWREWDPDLVAPCHKRPSGRWYGSVYGRMSWDELAPTITTQCTGFGNGRYGHPEQDRAISLREAALLQTFPARYEFFEPERPWSISTTARLIGNAVPVTLARAIAGSIGETLEAADV